ncbi:hypothetical protein, partial [Photorhabdus sp. RM105S]
VIFRVAQYVPDRRKTAKAALVFSSRYGGYRSYPVTAPQRHVLQKQLSFAVPVVICVKAYVDFTLEFTVLTLSTGLNRKFLFKCSRWSIRGEHKKVWGIYVAKQLKKPL